MFGDLGTTDQRGEDGTMRRPLLARKLLIASLGVATISYVGCADNNSGGDGGTVVPGPEGNLMAPPPSDASGDVSFGPEGNLMAPPPSDASGDVSFGPEGNLMAPPPSDAADAPSDVSFGPEGNLMAPPPSDASSDAPEGG